jgi:hypothetical protein
MQQLHIRRKLIWPVRPGRDNGLVHTYLARSVPAPGFPDATLVSPLQRHSSYDFDQQPPGVMLSQLVLMLQLIFLIFLAKSEPVGEKAGCCGTWPLM